MSDAGTPGISDPGYRLVSAARSAGIQVVPVPGPSAVLAALVSSGFPTDSFLFLGFPPRKQQARRQWASQLALETRTVVFFESPHRLRQTLEDLQQYLVDRPICVARELTKAHEELVVRPIGEFLKLTKTPRGEYVLTSHPPDFGGGHSHAFMTAIAEYYRDHRTCLRPNGPDPKGRGPLQAAISHSLRGT